MSYLYGLFNTTVATAEVEWDEKDDHEL